MKLRVRNISGIYEVTEGDDGIVVFATPWPLIVNLFMSCIGRIYPTGLPANLTNESFCDYCKGCRLEEKKVRVPCPKCGGKP